ncbi:cation-translocating P-type ATPase [Reyranella sp.]|uniref:cation-translocating P-type ATPase n=1 Tax=Reyranella sp. TaxID=1929291 RepID=UPI003BA9F233
MSGDDHREPTGASGHGLTAGEAEARLAQHGPNALPEVRPPSLPLVFLRQFLSPLIYVLAAAALVSLLMGDLSDALFIGVVLLMNGAIGTVQEHSASRAAAALRAMEQPRATVIRDGAPAEIDARRLVPGDLVLLEAGGRVPADLRLLASSDLQCDESLLTGESAPVRKSAAAPVGEAERRPDADHRLAMAFAGSTIVRGRARGIVTATGRTTEIGRIAAELGKRSMTQPPLIIRMERFARLITLAVGVAVVLLVLAGLMRDMALRDLFLLSVALAVSAIPEGLPVAISVALAIGMRRMAGVHVIVRRMAAVESLGSCTLIATDKTGTLTLNQLTVTDLCLPDGTLLACEAGDDLDACAVVPTEGSPESARRRVATLLRSAALPNEARLVREREGWSGAGDSVDIALLAAARKGGLVHEDLMARYPLASRIPYEPDLRYAASFHAHEGGIRVFVKGAPETVIAMADRMEVADGLVATDRARLLAQKEALAARGLRVLAFAEGEIAPEPEGGYGHRHLLNLVFVGLAGMQDPVRPEVPGAIRDCRRAGIGVAMLTGDDPRTALAIAAQAGLDAGAEEVVTGDRVRAAEEEGPEALDRLTRRARIFARVEPAQKLAIVMSQARNGHFVAVTGDGVNDAPALKHAHVGVAMGRKGTEVAKESADIVITDDNFASIVKGIEEGRVAYANIRKIVFMLVSTGAAELMLFLLAIPLGLPMPLLPVQLLWLNLVTNGLQDVALATEPAEGDELAYPPRPPREPIFDRVMIRRILHSTLVMGVGGFAVFWWLIERGTGEAEARNLLLLLFVLFENFQTFNSRSEHHSVFRQRLFANPLLLLAVIGAQVLHIGAMHLPVLRDLLHIAPVSLSDWAVLLLLAAVLLAVMEAEKWWDQRRAARAR